MLKLNVGTRWSKVSTSVAAVGLCLLMAGCSEEPRGGPRIEVVPHKGKLLVDGEPAFDALVRFYPEVPHKLPPGGTAANSAANVDQQGNFVVSTYENGDGLPVGEYKIGITWKERSGMTMRARGGPDRLKGKYEDPETTGFTLSVSAGSEEITIPTFELTTEE